MEVLSPTKNFKTAKIAVQNGADALYFASPSFGARTNASLKLEEIEEIIKYARLYQVKTYITFNTVIFDNEIEKFFKEINQIYQIGADGVILQDFALVEIIKDNFPELEAHASTQMHVHNTDGVNFVKSLGANRVVVPREMNFERIRQIKDDTNIDIECFIHGAICVSYSGQCYDSTLLDQKSANRGRCSQYCRMPQQIINTRNDSVVNSGNYPLNLKDMNNLENVDKYIEAGVDSLKIEGRLKNFDYVGLTTKAYKEAVLYAENKIDNRFLSADDLTKVYNRKFTTGRINKVNGEQLVNLDKPNNTGRLVGKVIDIEKNLDQDLGYYDYVITIDSDEPLIKQDNIRFINKKFEDGQVVEKIKSVNGSKIELYSKIKAPIASDVYRTQDATIIDEFTKQLDKYNRREMIDVSLKVEDYQIFYKLADGEYVNSNIEMAKAQKQPVTKDKFLKKLLKTNDTPFTFNIQEFIYDEDLFIAMGQIGSLKTVIIDAITAKRLKTRNVVDVKLPEINLTQDTEAKIYVEVRTKEQYDTVKASCDYEVLIGDIKLIEEIEFDAEDRLVIPRINYNDEFAELDKIVEKYPKICVSEIGSLNRYHNQGKDIISNFTLNVTNIYTLNKLKQLGVTNSLMSIELNYEKLKQVGFSNTVLNIYGRVPVMIMDYCPINHNKQDKCGSCRRCHKATYVLKDEYDRVFPLMYEGNARIGMYSKAPVCLMDKQEELSASGINKFHLRFTNENASQVVEVLNNTKTKTVINDNFIRGSYYKETL